MEKLRPPHISKESCFRGRHYRNSSFLYILPHCFCSIVWSVFLSVYRPLKPNRS